jgi:hypothetical protein
MIRVIEADAFSTTRFTLADWAKFHARVDELAANRGAELDNTTDVGVFPLFDPFEFELHIEARSPGDDEETKCMTWVCDDPARGGVRVFGCELPDNESLHDELNHELDRMAMFGIDLFPRRGDPGEQEPPESWFEQVPWEEEDEGAQRQHRHRGMKDLVRCLHGLIVAHRLSISIPRVAALINRIRNRP